MPLLNVSNLAVSYGDLQVLWDMSLSADEGEVVSIIGANGAGKTTSLKTIAGILKPKSGTVDFNGNPVGGLGPYATVNLGIVYVPEGRRVFPRMSVRENLELGAYSTRARPMKEETLRSVFELFPILENRHGQLAGTLSGGEQQMLAIGRGLMAHPRLLMLDEPSFGLAPLLVERILETIRKISGKGIGVLLVEQDVARALEISSRAYLLESGKVVRQGPSSRLTKDAYVREAYLGL
jgi:branched-chain amino acid transport system ATP-binding protein